MLADEFVACREIEDDVGTGKGEIVARRNGCPHVLAYLNAEFHSIAGCEYLRTRGDDDRTAGKVYRVLASYIL